MARRKTGAEVVPLPRHFVDLWEERVIFLLDRDAAVARGLDPGSIPFPEPRELYRRHHGVWRVPADGAVALQKPWRRDKQARVPYSPLNSVGERGMYPQDGALALLERLLKAGYGVREAARLSGMNRNTASKARAALVRAKGEIFCECGRPSAHRGFCRRRLANSPKRQEFLKRWHSRPPTSQR